MNGNDGILARDLNNNGKIDDATEVFGNTTTNGFDALGALDNNNDGQITAADAAFSSLKIWKDTNANGVTDTGELTTLAQNNIASITVSNYTATNGDKGVSHIGIATTTSGQIIEVANYNVSVDQRNSAYTKDYNLDLRALFLPTLKGHGNVADLHIAASLDNGTATTTMMSRLIGLMSHDRKDLFLNWDTTVRGEFKDMLYHWAGVESVSSTSRGPYVDGKEISFLEQYFGVTFTNAFSTGMPANDNTTPKIAECFPSRFCEKLWA